MKTTQQIQKQYARNRMVTATLMLAALALFTTGALAQTALAIAPGNISAETPGIYYERGALTSPSDDKPFGGEVVGNYFVRVNDHNVKINVDFNALAPSEGMVLEGWLVDVDSDYKLSIGQFNTTSNGLLLNQNMVNFGIYDILVITEELANDDNPAPNKPVGGVLLGTS